MPRSGRSVPGKDPVTTVQEAWWASGPVWTGAENFTFTGIRSPDRPSRSETLYRLSYPVLSKTTTFLTDNFLLSLQIKKKSVGISEVPFDTFLPESSPHVQHTAFMYSTQNFVSTSDLPKLL